MPASPVSRLILSSVVLLIPFPSPLSAAEPQGTRVDQLSAESSGSAVTISGSATFVATLAAGTDAVDDAQLENTGIPVNDVGADLTSASISATSQGEGMLSFTLAVSDMPAVTNGASEAVHYTWHVVTPTAGYCLRASTRGQLDPPAGPLFRLFPTTCAPLWQFDPRLPSTVIQGALGGGSVRFDVPMSLIGAASGVTIAGSQQAVSTTLGLAGQATVRRADWLSTSAIEIPSATVRVGIAPAGTPLGEVPLATTASVSSSDGSFTASMPSPDPGSYVAVAEACYGPNSCARAGTTVSV